MRYYLNIALFCLLVFGQGCTAQKNSRRYRVKMRDAKILREEGGYYQAYRIYKDIWEEDSLNAEIRYGIGVCLLHMTGHQEEAFERLLYAWEKNELGPYYLARACHANRMFDAAMHYYEISLNQDNPEVNRDEIARHIAITRRAMAMVKDPIHYNIFNLGPRINTYAHEYVPVLSGDEQELYFTSRREGEGVLLDPTGQPFEDVFYTYQEGSLWQEPVRLDTPMNSATHDATAGIAPSGDKLLLYRTHQNISGGNILIAERKDGGWSAPEILPSPVNSEYQEASASLSADERVMYFSSNRPGGYGGKDIYRSRMLPNGSWGIPENLGPVINTVYDEDAPFIFSDDKTLYFSSNGHSTMGGYDVFTSRLSAEGRWSQPKNLGYPLNTVNDDLYLVVTKDGTRGYFSSVRSQGEGGQDIYQVSFPVESEYDVVQVVIMSEALEPLKAKVTLLDQSDKALAGIYQTNSQSGRCILLMEPGKNYELFVESAGMNVRTLYLNAEDHQGEKDLIIELKKE